MTHLRKPKIHPAFQEALEEGVKFQAMNTKAIRVMSKVIAERMEELHGGEWKVQIDHENGLVAISREWQLEARS
jgi:hypothetical protein